MEKKGRRERSKGTEVGRDKLNHRAFASREQGELNSLGLLAALSKQKNTPKQYSPEVVLEVCSWICAQ